MMWAPLHSFDLSEVILPGYEQAQLSRSGIPEVCERLREWYPDIVAGNGAKFLRSDFYEEYVSLRDEDDRNTIAYCGRRGDDLMSLLILTRNDQSRSVFGELGVVAPGHRNAGLAIFGGFMMEAQTLALGYTMAYTFATLKTPAMQRMLERAGFRPVGIVPASDREADTSGMIRSVTEVMYAKIFGEGDQFTSVRRENMTERVARLWDVISSGSGPA